MEDAINDFSHPRGLKDCPHRRVDGKKVIARLLLGQSYEVGTTYDFAVPERHLKFFDRTTEKRVDAKALAWQ